MTKAEGTLPTFAQRMKARETLYGTVVKIPTPHATEVIASVGYDFVVIVQEHAPVDRTRSLTEHSRT